jgi:FkbM family methyltransferase
MNTFKFYFSILSLFTIYKSKALNTDELFTCKLICIGNENYGGYCLCETSRLVDQSAVVYSFGIGEDISFDEGLIISYNISVYGFDPTPRSIEFVAKKNNPNFIFTPKALCKEDKKIHLYPPVNTEYVSHNQIRRDGIDPIEVDCLSLTNASNIWNHKKIDILKVDIEGEELNIFSDANFFVNMPKFDQLLIEVHPFDSQKVNKLFENIGNAGYILVHRHNNDYSFKKGYIEKIIDQEGRLTKVQKHCYNII